jgi:hypothetical protein
MRKKLFAPQGVAYELSSKIIRTVEMLRDGEDIGRIRLTEKEMNEIGLCYWYGHIVDINYKEAVNWYKAAAEKRYKSAAFNLYVCYNNGMGVPEDGRAALYWLRKAARHNHPGAQNILAECYYTGGLVRRNRRLAKLWFQKSFDNAMEKNIEVTLNSFGVNYYRGKYGFEKNRDMAIKCFEKAGEKGYCLSIAWLILIFIDEDNEEKVEYWRKKYEACAVKDPYVTQLFMPKYNDYIKGKKNEQRKMVLIDKELDTRNELTKRIEVLEELLR